MAPSSITSFQLLSLVDLIFTLKGKNVLGDGTSPLYTLIVQPDNTVHDEVDQDHIFEGSIIEDW